MGATAQHGVEPPPVIEHRDPQPVDLDRKTPALLHISDIANRHEFRHAITLTNRRAVEKTKRLGLASETARPVESRGPIRPHPRATPGGPPGMTWLRRPMAWLALTLVVSAAGCDVTGRSRPELVWGIHGTRPGWLHKPRVAAFDAEDHLYLAD